MSSLSGALAGLTAVLVTYPLELVRTRMAFRICTDETALAYRTLTSSLRQVLSQEIALGLTLTLTPTPTLNLNLNPNPNPNPNQVRYLAAKRAVEAKLMGSGKLRPIMFRPSLIWSWDKFDVLPVIPVFNIASALGVPFVDKTIRVEVRGIALGLGLG